MRRKTIFKEELARQRDWLAVKVRKKDELKAMEKVSCYTPEGC